MIYHYGYHPNLPTGGHHPPLTSLWPPSPTHYGHPHLLTMATLTYSLWSPSPTHFGHPHLLTMATSPTHYGHPHLLTMATLTYSLWPPSPTHYGHLTYSLWPPSPTHYGHPHLLTMATLTYSLWPPSPTHYGHLTYSLWPPSPTHYGHPHLLTMATSPTHYGHLTLTYSLWPPLPRLITVNYNKHQIKDQLFMQTCRAPLKLTLYLQLVHTPCYACSMNHLISFSPSSQLTKAQWELLWKEHCSTIPEALPKFLQCVDWASLEQVQEAHRLLKIWRPITMEVCLRWPLRAREVTTPLILGGPSAVGLPLC